MPGEKSKMTPIETQKQLLLLESDLNRARLIETAQEWKAACHHTKERLAHLGAMASTAATVATTFSTVRRFFTRSKTGENKGWLSLLLDGMSTGTSLWYWMRSKRRKEDD